MAYPLVVVRDSVGDDSDEWQLASEAEFGREVRSVELVGDRSINDEPFSYDLEADAGVIAAAAREGAHVVAPTHAAVAAIRAAEHSPGTVISLVLFEPAALSLASDNPHVQEYLAGDTARPEMLVPLNPDVFASVPTLALTTGHAPPAFQAVLDKLADLGAEVATVATAGSVSGIPSEANDLVRDFADRAESRASG